MENIQNNYLEKSINVFNKYLSKNEVDSIYKFCDKLNKDTQKISNNFDFLELLDFHMETCLRKISKMIFSNQRHYDFKEYVDDEIQIYNFMLTITLLLEGKHQFKNKLESINNSWIHVFIHGKDYVDDYFFDEEEFDYYIKRKNDFFNSLDKSGQNIFNLQYLYLSIISASRYNSEDNTVKIIKEKICHLLIHEIKPLRNENPILDISKKLTTALASFVNSDKDKDKFLEILKFINLNDNFLKNNNFLLLGNEIVKCDYDFFDEMFEKIPEMNNYRPQLAIESIKRFSLNMFDYFLSEKYISDLNNVDETKIQDIDYLKKTMPWANKQFGYNVLELNNILLNILGSHDQDLFFNIFSRKGYKKIELPTMNSFISKFMIDYQYKEKQLLLRLNEYFNFLEPLLTKNFLEKSIYGLRDFKDQKNIDHKAIDDIHTLLQKRLDNLKKIKKLIQLN